MINTEFWRNCSTCKRKIGYKTKYYECSVSTCTGKRTGYVFCSISCWESHLPGARHRDAGALEKASPSIQEWQNEMAKEIPPAESAEASSSSSSSSSSAANSASAFAQRTLHRPSSASSGSLQKTTMDNEVLVVVSKMKTYVKEKADMNTANEVSDTISHFIRRICDDAIDRARAEGRKTIMARDFKL